MRAESLWRNRELVIAGVLMSYGNNLTWPFRTTADYGAKRNW